MRIAQIIRRFATASLAADIDLHLPVALHMEGKSINQIISFLNSGGFDPILATNQEKSL
jgi:hypothetical protein